MNSWKRYFIALLTMLFIFSCSACGGAEAPASSQLNGTKILKGTDFRYTLDFGCRETFHLKFFVTDAYDPDLGSAGVYMLDVDSGVLYDDSFLDWDRMSVGNDWNMDTRETALMVLFITYVDNMDSGVIWSSEAKSTRLSKQDLDELWDQLTTGANVAPQNSVPAVNIVDSDSSPSEEPAVSTLDPEFVYEQASLLNIQLKEAARYTGTLEEGCRETLDLLFLRSTEFDADNQIISISAPGLYMQDLSTGKWYDGSFVNWAIMAVDDRMNLDTKECAMMWTFQRFADGEGGRFPAADHFLWSSYEQKLYLDEDDLETVNQKLLFDQLTRQKPSYPYATIQEEERKLSDDELRALFGQPAGLVKSIISTVPDAIAYLDLRYPELWMGLSMTNGVDLESRWLRAAQEILYTSADAIASRTCIVNCVTYLLDDDYEIVSLIAFWPDGEKLNDSGPEKAINMIKTANGYLFFDPVLGMQGDAGSRYGDLLPQMKCGSLAEYIENIRQNPHLSSTIKYIFQNTGGVRMDYQHLFNPNFTIETNSPGIEMVYFSVDAKEAGSHVSPENIDSYMLSSMLGGVTLKAEEAYALVGAAPEVVQEKVKTAADVLMYMLAARLADSKGCKCTDVGKYTWHWNMSAKEVMEKKLGNCGSCANLANYLLDGDYEEVGYMDHAYYPGSGGSHVYTYILHEGKYYIVDYSWYIFNNYEPTMDYTPSVLKSLDEWAKKGPQVYGDLNLIMTYDTPGMQYPVIFGDQYASDFDDIYYYILPEGVEYKVLYEGPNGYVYHHIPFDRSAYEWNVFW